MSGEWSYKAIILSLWCQEITRYSSIPVNTLPRCSALRKALSGCRQPSVGRNLY